MTYKILAFMLLSIVLSETTIAQEQIRGSRNVTVEQTSIDEFTAMEIGEEFEVVIVEGSEAMVEIETDDNLHEVIDVDVIGGTLYLQTIKEIRRSKRLNIRITFTSALNEIRIKEKAEVSSLTDLLISDITISTADDAEFYATIKAETFKLVNNGSAKVELNIEADSTVFQLNQRSEIKALVKSPVFKADLLEDAKARIEGDVDELSLRADNSSEFTGERLTSQNCNVIIEGRAKASVKVDETITITAKGRSELSIYDSPTFTITEFSDEAVLFKK